MEFLFKLLSLPFRIIKALYYKVLFKTFGWRSIMDSPLKINGANRISIGNRCSIMYKTWLAAVPLTGEDCQLIIEDGCCIGHFNHIYATGMIVLHKNVLTADKVYISDNLHNYKDVNVPVMYQPVNQKKHVEIGEGSWLGENVCVLGACVGRHCVIGANSVVTHDIPDYTVAVGIPAKVIKRYNFEQYKWVNA